MRARVNGEFIVDCVSFEFTYAELGLGTTSVTGDMEMAFEDTWALFCIHHFNQDGLVRQRPRLTAWLGSWSALW
jgi:hypothetical protein